MKYLVAIVGVLAATPAMAQSDTPKAPESAIGGFRIEAHVGIERPNLNESSAGVTYVAKLGSALAYGGEVGYDIPVSDRFTVGPYVSFDMANSDVCDSGPVPGGTVDVCFKASSLLSGGLRGAVAVGDSGEAFVTLGYAKYDYDYAEVVTNGLGQVIDVYSASGDEGIDVGFGYNHMIATNIYAGLGFRITELGDFEGTPLNLQRFQGQVNLGFRF